MSPPNTSSLPRRHDVDWLRAIAIGFLIIFHVALSFQAWGSASGLPQNDELLEGLVPFISFLAVWRIPLLFMVSGMGVRFAMERRDWKQLLQDRTLRILLPYMSGMLVFGPALALGLPRMGWDAEFFPSFGHLWFLLNIYLYVLWLLGIMVYIRDHPTNALSRFLSTIIRGPFGLFLFALPLMVEAFLTSPDYFSIYVDNVHGWILGLLCFFYGFIFISAQDEFWPAVVRVRWVAFALGVTLYLARFLVFEFENELTWLTGLESMSWMLAILGFGSLYLNTKSRTLSYLSGAAYPVYILHFPVQFIVAYFLFPHPLSAYAKLGLLLAGTFGISFLLYEFPLRRLKWIRPLFGMKLRQG